MGSVIGFADDAGTGLGTLDYDGFGNARGGDAVAASTAGDFRFQGMWKDPTGLYYVRARTYEAETGRFTSRDPANGDRRASELFQAYAFGVGNPRLHIDPTGRVALIEVLAAVTMVGIVATTALAYIRSKPSLDVLAYDPSRSEDCSYPDDCIAGTITHYTLARNPFVRPITIASVRDLVDQTVGISKDTGRLIGTLTILDHGAQLVAGEQSFGVELEIGDDVVRRDNFAKYASDLSRLAPLFAPDGALRIANCHAGMDEPLLQLFADTVGVRTYGHTMKTMPHLGWNPGDETSCEPLR